jgi:hypothetical protein
MVAFHLLNVTCVQTSLVGGQPCFAAFAMLQAHASLVQINQTSTKAYTTLNQSLHTPQSKFTKNLRDDPIFAHLP